MSFHIRKSINIGPVRFNISKSGIGMSFGTTGAHVSTGPRGTYVHLGRKGIYYRQRIDNSPFDSETQTGSAHKRESIRDSRNSSGRNSFVGSSNSVAISQINERLQQPTCAGTMLVVSIFGELIAVAVLTSVEASLIRSLLIFAAIVGWILLMALTWATNEQEKLARTTTLRYTLDEEANREYSDFLETLKVLSRSGYIWRIANTVVTSDWKRNAGATSLVDRSRVRASLSTPPFIDTNVDVYRFTLGEMQLFFLPDQILIFHNSQYHSLSYTSLKIEYGPVTFREVGPLPTDAEIVDHTWRYVRKDGGPDMRFSGNHRVPIVLYWLVQLYLSHDIGARLHVSNVAYGQRFSYGLSNYILYHQITKAASAKKTSSSSSRSSFRSESRTGDQRKKASDGGRSSRSRKHNQEKTRQKTHEETFGGGNPYTVLKVSQDAQWEDITAAYRKLVQMYHPDKVAGLAPEYRVIAERKMKELNAAYSDLRRRYGQ